MKKIKQDHKAWVDLLRVMACFLVVLAHCCDPFVARFDSNRFEFLSGAFWGSLVRPCVPLFVMMTGVLLLPIKEDMSTFYNKRIKRVLIPLIFWSILTPLFYYFYLNSGITTLSPNIDPVQHTWSATLMNLYLFIFNFTYTTIPLWYLYMLVGLYLFMPIIGAWLNQASQKDMKRFLLIWGFSMCLPYIQMAAPLFGYTGNYGNMGILGVCAWNPYGTFYYFSGFLGYIVLAHYLTKYPLEWSWRGTLSITVPLFLIGYAITAIGFLITQKFYPGNYDALEIVWYFSGINVFMMTYAVFVIISKIEWPSSQWITKLASLTFGIYLCHFFIVQVGYDLLYDNLPLPAYLLIPINALLAFTVSAGLIWLMSKSSLLKRFIS